MPGASRPGDPDATPTAWSDPPAADELEVTLFGPGYGECIAVHLGESEWMIVDSCIPKGFSPAGEDSALAPEAHPALAYLLGLGVDLGDVTRLVATHWHDDHVRGLDHLVAHCPRAQLITSPVLSADELLVGLCEADPLDDQRITNGVEVMRRAVVRAEQDRRWKTHAEGVFLPTRSGTAVLLLAPSASSQVRAQRELGRLLDLQRHGDKVRVSPPRRNDSCIVLWVECPGNPAGEQGSISVLLGGDLEVVRDEDQGWRGVHGSEFRPTSGRASLVKVAHHGSANGQYVPVWTDMTAAPLALLTPWDRGRGLPTDAGLATVRAYASTVAATAALPLRNKKRNGVVRQTIDLTGGRATSRATYAAGQRESAPSGPDWRLHLVPPAVKI